VPAVSGAAHDSPCGARWTGRANPRLDQIRDFGPRTYPFGKKISRYAARRPLWQKWGLPETVANEGRSSSRSYQAVAGRSFCGVVGPGSWVWTMFRPFWKKLDLPLSELIDPPILPPTPFSFTPYPIPPSHVTFSPPPLSFPSHAPPHYFPPPPFLPCPPHSLHSLSPSSSPASLPPLYSLSSPFSLTLSFHPSSTPPIFSPLLTRTALACGHDGPGRRNPTCWVSRRRRARAKQARICITRKRTLQSGRSRSMLA